MIWKGRATVTEPHVSISIAPAGDVAVLDMWGDGAPLLYGVRAMQVEPRRWWLVDTGDKIEAITKALGENGAITPIGCGLMRATLTCPGWRFQLMISGMFDAENSAFKPGDCAATIIGHVSVWIDVISAETAHVYFAASLRTAIEHVWVQRAD